MTDTTVKKDADGKPTKTNWKGYRQLDPAEYEYARSRYEEGTRTLMELSIELGVTPQSLSQRFKRYGVVKGSKIAEEKERLHKAAIAHTESFIAKRIGWIEETRLAGVNVLKQALLLARHTVSENVKAGRPPAAIDGDLRALRRYNALVVENVEASLRVLQAHTHTDETNLPSLIVKDLTDEDILNHHKRIGVVSPDATLEDLTAEQLPPVDEEL